MCCGNIQAKCPHDLNIKDQHDINIEHPFYSTVIKSSYLPVFHPDILAGGGGGGGSRVLGM